MTELGLEDCLRGEYTDAETGFQHLRDRYYDPATGQFLNRDPIEALTRSAYGYAATTRSTTPTPPGCSSTTTSAGIGGAIEDAWDATGGRAVTWVAENPGTAITVGAVGVCVVASLGTCAVATGGAYLARATERVVDDGFSNALGANLVDAGLTYATFGLVTAPASLGLTRGGSTAITGPLGAGQRGIMAGSRLWQQALARSLAASPDLAGLLGGWWFDERRMGAISSADVTAGANHG